mgnify:CR=1 FL=1
MYIYTKADLESFSKRVNNGETTLCAKLMNDIVWNEGTFADDGKFTKKDGLTSTPEEWTPIGNSSNKYTGTFDGNGHTIKGLYINSGSGNVGLFGYVGSGGKVQNVGVIDGYIKGNYSVGGVCGENSGTIENCYNTGTVSGSGDYVGGVCGENKGTIENCYNTGYVSGKSAVGGICGCVSDSGFNVVQSYNTGTVSGYISIGGVFGKVESYNGKVTNCYNTGNISGTTAVGGVFGEDTIITVPGVISHLVVEKCYNVGKVSGSLNVGGVIGIDGSSTVWNCFYNSEACGVNEAIGNKMMYRGSVKGLTTTQMTGTTEVGRAGESMKEIIGDGSVWNVKEDDNDYAYYPHLKEFTNSEDWPPKVQLGGKVTFNANGGTGSSSTFTCLLYTSDAADD